MNEPIHEATLKNYISGRFAMLTNFRQSQILVDFGHEETMSVSCGEDIYFLMESGSDDDRYRFELWLNGRNTGIYVEFAFYGEEL